MDTWSNLHQGCEDNGESLIPVMNGAGKQNIHMQIMKPLHHVEKSTQKCKTWNDKTLRRKQGWNVMNLISNDFLNMILSAHVLITVKLDKWNSFNLKLMCSKGDDEQSEKDGRKYL